MNGSEITSYQVFCQAENSATSAQGCGNIMNLDAFKDGGLCGYPPESPSTCQVRNNKLTGLFTHYFLVDES